MTRPESNDLPPRILFVTRKWAPAMGGMERYSQRLVEQLRMIEPVECIALPGRADGQPPSPLALLTFPFAVLRSWLARRSDPPVVLHLGDLALWPLGLLARTTARRTRVAISLHGTDAGYHRRRTWRGAAYRFYLRLGARMLRDAVLIANSRATADAAGEAGWRTRAIVPLATDMQEPNLRPEGTAHLLFAGRLIPRKGLLWFVREVLPLLPKSIRLRVAGARWDAAEGAALNDPRVDYLGILTPPALATAYATASCVIVPNIDLHDGEFEGFGLVAPEAAAAGGIVVAAALDGIFEAVRDGETGFLVASGDAREWADRIMDIANWDASRRADFVARSRKSIATHYSWDRVARQTMETYGIDR
jgi:glycosyltransferase involved in cell wall biosynthesis